MRVVTKVPTRPGRVLQSASAVGLALVMAPSASAASMPVCAGAAPARIAAAVDAAALRFAIPASWLRAVIRVESAGAVCAVSPKGAIGLMQVMPATYAGLRARHGLGDDPFDVGDNLLAGAAYLSALCARYGAPGCFAAYNAGPGRYERHLAGQTPLPSETQGYLRALAPLTRAAPSGSPSGRLAATPGLFVLGIGMPSEKDASSDAPAAPASRLFATGVRGADR